MEREQTKDTLRMELDDLLTMTRFVRGEATKLRGRVERGGFDGTTGLLARLDDCLGEAERCVQEAREAMGPLERGPLSARSPGS